MEVKRGRVVGVASSVLPPQPGNSAPGSRENR